MKQRLFTIFVVLSLVLCVLNTAVWLYTLRELPQWSVSGVFVNPQFGKWWVHWQTAAHPVPPNTAAIGRPLCWCHFAFIDFLKTDQVVENVSGAIPRKIGYVSYDLYVPFWEISLVSASLPAWWLARWRRNRHKPGFCQKCGYDLRASQERCPECGNPIPAISVKTSAP